MKTAIVTGCCGQDGSLLSEYLLRLGYKVYGIHRRISSVHIESLTNIVHLISNPNFKLVAGDITDSSFIYSIVREVQPDEMYNLAAMSHVAQSFKEPVQTFRVDGESVLIQLEAIRQFSPHTRYYQASTSELYGGLECPKTGYTELSPFHPRSPYAVAKLAAHHAVINYREAYSIHGSCGILFNHSSTRRGLDFATRKITSGIASIKAGKTSKLLMGNLHASRDEGSAADYVKAMHLMLQQEVPDNYVVATGETATIGDMLSYVCDLAGLDAMDIYEQDPRYMRPSDVPMLLGDSSKIRALGWEPSYSWKSLLKEMYEYDLQLLIAL